MKNVWLLVSLSSLFVCSASLWAEEPKNNALDSLQGSWSQVSKETDGEKKLNRNAVLAFKADKFEIVANELTVESGVITVDAAKKPHAYTVKVNGGAEESQRTFHGIYELDGDTLKTCVNTEPSKPAPTEFVSKAGSGHQLVVWKRVKP